VSKRSINIDRLQIRIKGVSAGVARAAIKDLGPELLGQLAVPAERSGTGQSTTIGKIDAGRAQVGSGTTPAGLRNLIAQRVADSIKTNLRKR
jgi:hypothetical protein